LSSRPPTTTSSASSPLPSPRDAPTRSRRPPTPGLPRFAPSARRWSTSWLVRPQAAPSASSPPSSFLRLWAVRWRRLPRASTPFATYVSYDRTFALMSGSNNSSGSRPQGQAPQGTQVRSRQPPLAPRRVDHRRVRTEGRARVQGDRLGDCVNATPG
jgi:hypothetical protein